MSDRRPFRASGFFALRSPLLPVEALEAWTDGSPLAEMLDGAVEGMDDDELGAALEADRSRLRERLVALLETPEIAEAIFVASPDLHEALAAWREDPDDPNHARVEAAVVRYLLRMTTRATPFGLFSGCSVGTLVEGEDAPAARLELAPRTAYERHSRLDNDYLFALGETLAHDGLADELPVFPNSTLYRVAGRLRYAESRLAGRRRTYHLVAVDPDPYLDATLERARSGALPGELARALADDLAREAAEAGEDDDEVPTLDEVREYVGELVESQLLVSELSPPVTGDEPIHDLVGQLSGLADSPEGHAAVRRLEGARDALARLDAAGLGALPEHYREIASGLEPLGTEMELSRLFQVDMMKPAERLELGPALVEEIDRAVELVHRIQPEVPRGDRLEEFARAFGERYEDGRLVPLSEVLDEEMGIGFQRQQNVLADASPVLQGLPWPAERGAARPPGLAPGTVPWGAGWAHLLERLRQVWSEGSRVLELTDEDVERLTHPDPLPLPDAFAARVEIAARSIEAVDRGEYSLGLGFVSGPSGANLLGRFCHASPELAHRVRQHLADEEAHDRDAIYAEIVHLPEGRIGNVLSRPVLRSYEIPFLGRSGAPAERQIPVEDLLVTVSGGTVRLVSKSLGRRIHPRLTTAHNYSRESLGLYRFLASLQTQGVAGGVLWSWSAFEGAAFLPRVTRGRLVLKRARWSVTAPELAPVREAASAHGTHSAAFFRAVDTWRRGRGIDRRAAVADGDNELLVDFRNPLVAASFFDLVKNRPKFELVEIYPPLDELPTRSAEGRFVAEILVPYVRRAEAEVADARGSVQTAAPPAPRPASAAPRAEPIGRIFPVASSWLYAKLYTGSSTADRVLTQVIAPVHRAAFASGAARSWFFIRYGDPAWHLRVRFRGEPERLLGEVLPALREHLEAAGGDRLAWRLQLDTYEREIERYGGPHGIELAEELFAVDSDAVLALAALLEGDAGADARWRLGLYGVDRLLADFRLDLAARERFARGHREAFARRFGVEGSGFTRALAPKLRGERRELDRLLFGERPHPELEPGLAVLDRRSRRLEPLVAEILRRTGDGRIADPPEALLGSIVHMFVNRLTRSGGPEHEMVIYDFLSQLYASRFARERAMRKKKKKT